MLPPIAEKDQAKARRHYRRWKCFSQKHNNNRRMIKNFRPLKGFQDVYRCGSTDGGVWKAKKKSSLVFQHAGLILDLRSPLERDETKAQAWMQEASRKYRRPIRVVTVDGDDDDDDDSCITHPGFFEEQTCYVLRLDVLNKEELLAYAKTHWLSNPAALGTEGLQNAAMEELNARGLAGLNEAILETSLGKRKLCWALKLMTLYREATMESSLDPKETSIVFHCVQGKDRTGMLAMLMQVLLGTMSDKDIVEEYHRSNAAFVQTKTGSAAVAVAVGRSPPKVRRMDKAVFHATNPEAMIETLKGLREKYPPHGVVGYLEAIGFHDGWRQRFRTAFRKREPSQRFAPSRL